MVMFRKTEKETLVLSALAQIKSFEFIIFNLQLKKAGSLNTTSETLFSDPFKTGFLYIIQNIVCWEEGTGTPQIKLGLYDGVTKFPYEIGTVANAKDSVGYIGQLFAREGLKVYADFENAVLADTIYMNFNGYRVKR